MREFNTLLLLFIIVSIAFGKAINETISSKENDIREDLDVDYENNIDSITSTSILFEGNSVGDRLYSGKGTLCERGTQCTMSWTYTDPFYYGDNQCQFRIPTAGEGDYFRELGSNNKSKHFIYDSLLFNVHIDLYGYMQCLINKKKYPEYRKYHLTGGVNSVSRNDYEDYIRYLYHEGFKRMVLYSGKNEWYYNKFELFIEIYH